MHEDMRALLNAYLDNELRGTRLLELKLHLASCEACREELKDLRQVSDLLHSAPAPDFMPVERFVANLSLNLPRRTLRDRPPKPGSLAWWLVPAGLLGLWFFLRTAFAITSVLSVADSSGLLGSSSSWFGSDQQTVWFPLLNTVMSGQSGIQSTLSTLNDVSLIGGDLLGGFLWQAFIVLLYWGWLAAWWLRRRPRPMKVTANPVRS